MPETETTNAIKIAVLQEQILGIREQQRAHNDSAQSRFNSLEDKLDEFTAILNRGRGAYAVSMALAAVIGATLLQAVGFVSSYVHK